MWEPAQAAAAPPGDLELRDLNPASAGEEQPPAKKGKGWTVSRRLNYGDELGGPVIAAQGGAKCLEGGAEGTPGPERERDGGRRVEV